MKKTKRQSSSLPVSLELQMECVEEDLSPWQKKAQAKAEKEYADSVKAIEEAKQEFTVNVVPLGVPTPPAPAPAKAPAKVQVNMNLNTRPKTSSPEIIILDEPSPPKKTIAPSRLQVPYVAKLARPPQPASQAAFSQHFVIRPGQPLQTAGRQPLTIAGANIRGLQPGQTYRLLNFSNSAGQPLQMKPAQQMMALSTSGPINRVPVQRVAAQPRRQENSNVPGTFGLGIKRAAEDDAAKNRKKQKSAGSQTANKPSDRGNWVPLDQYYYGKKEGDPAYREDKGEFRFKCWYCHKMLYNNLRLMLHMQCHIDSEKQQNLDLADLTQCKHCYKQFDTPFDLQCHIEKVHQNNTNVLVCRICEKDHDSRASLTTHMQNSHVPCEMPYICQLCNFRSSWYNDVVDHFKKRHDSSANVMCLYCLKVFKVHMSKSSGWGLTQNYYNHLQKHQLRNAVKKCTVCKLAFLNKGDAKNHKLRDHMPNHKGILNSGAAKASSNAAEQVMIQVPAPGSGKKSKTPKSLNAPSVIKVKDFRILRYRGIQGYMTCIECSEFMGVIDHYKKYMECSMCRFATCCSQSYASHMIGFHSGKANPVSHLRIPKERKLVNKLFCGCGFSSLYGNVIANHLVFCSKRTCYRMKPETKVIELEYNTNEDGDSDHEGYGVEDEELDESQPVASTEQPTSLLGVLGLKPKPAKKERKADILKLKPTGTTEASSQDVAMEVISDLLDSMFPEESSASRAKDDLLDNVVSDSQTKSKYTKAAAAKTEKISPAEEFVPPLLTGEEKWKTVKMKERLVPTKSSIFLGSGDVQEEENKMPEEGTIAAAALLAEQMFSSPEKSEPKKETKDEEQKPSDEVKNDIKEKETELPEENDKQAENPEENNKPSGEENNKPSEGTKHDDVDDEPMETDDKTDSVKNEKESADMDAKGDDDDEMQRNNEKCEKEEAEEKEDNDKASDLEHKEMEDSGCNDEVQDEKIDDKDEDGEDNDEAGEGVLESDKALSETENSIPENEESVSEAVENATKEDENSANENTPSEDANEAANENQEKQDELNSGNTEEQDCSKDEQVDYSNDSVIEKDTGDDSNINETVDEASSIVAKSDVPESSSSRPEQEESQTNIVEESDIAKDTTEPVNEEISEQKSATENKESHPEKITDNKESNSKQTTSEKPPLTSPSLSSHQHNSNSDNQSGSSSSSYQRQQSDVGGNDRKWGSNSSNYQSKQGSYDNRHGSYDRDRDNRHRGYDRDRDRYGGGNRDRSWDRNRQDGSYDNRYRDNRGYRGGYGGGDRNRGGYHQQDRGYHRNDHRNDHGHYRDSRDYNRRDRNYRY